MDPDQSKKRSLQEKNGTDILPNACEHLEYIIDNHLRFFSKHVGKYYQREIENYTNKKPEAMINTRKNKRL